MSRRFVSNPFRERHGPGETGGCRIRPPPGGPTAHLQRTPQIPRGTRAAAVQKARRGVQGLTPDGGAGKRLPGEGWGLCFGARRAAMLRGTSGSQAPTAHVPSGIAAALPSGLGGDPAGRSSPSSGAPRDTPPGETR